MGSRYYSGGRRRYLWNTEATYRCPHVTAPPWALVETAHKEGVHRLPEMFAAAHRRASAIRERDENNRPTNVCATCGAKLDKVGYRVWVEGRYEDVVAEMERLGRDAGPTLVSQRIGERLGLGDGWTVWPGSERYFGLKREAISWCREQSQQERAARAEA